MFFPVEYCCLQISDYDLLCPEFPLVLIPDEKQVQGADHTKLRNCLQIENLSHFNQNKKLYTY